MEKENGNYYNGFILGFCRLVEASWLVIVCCFTKINSTLSLIADRHQKCPTTKRELYMAILNFEGFPAQPLPFSWPASSAAARSGR